MPRPAYAGGSAQTLDKNNMSELSGVDNMYFVYVLHSFKDKKYYIGYTSDLKRRIKEHLEGRVESTKNRRPIELIYYEAFKYEGPAREQEIFYKTGQGRRVLKHRLQKIIQDTNINITEEWPSG